jgi:ribosomal protein S18 acetylase RimI-like enzyme
VTFVIRTAEPADFENVGQITLNAYVQDGHLPSEAEYGGMLADARTRAEEAELWVAEDATTGEVLGSVTFAAPGSTYNEVSDPDEGEFRMLAVSHAARGKGVGEALVQHCIRRARELGLSALVMSTQPSMTSAHRIYERLGFARTPEKDWKPVPEVSLLTYRLTLRSPASAGGAGTPTVG